MDRIDWMKSEEEKFKWNSKIRCTFDCFMCRLCGYYYHPDTGPACSYYGGNGCAIRREQILMQAIEKMRKEHDEYTERILQSLEDSK